MPLKKLSRPFPRSDLGMNGVFRTPSGAQWTSGICLPVAKLDAYVSCPCDSRITHLGYADDYFRSEQPQKKLSRPFPRSDMGMSGVFRTPSGAQWTSGICLPVAKLDAKVSCLCDSRITRLGYAEDYFRPEQPQKKLSRPLPWSDMGMSGVFPGCRVGRNEHPELVSLSPRLTQR